MTGDLSQAVDRHGLHVRNDGAAIRGDDAPSRSDAGRRGTAPLDLCRLTVLGESVQVDMALPTDVPISLLLPGIVDVLDSRGPSAATDRQGRSWVLSKVGMPPIAGTLTLNEASIRDGELLVLGAADAPAPPPLFDDLMYAVAATGSEAAGLWTARTAQRVGFAVGAIAIVLACLSLLRPLLDVGDTGSGNTHLPADIEAGIGAAVAAVLFVVAGAIVGRFYQDDRTGVFLSGCALPLMFTSGIRFVPGEFGGPHLLLGGALVGASAILALRLGNHGTALFTASASAAGLVCGASALTLFVELPLATVGAGTAVIALAGLAVAPRISMMQARLPLPPVPTAGAPLDENDEEDQPSAADLAHLARRARSYLTGLVCAACAAAATGALLAALGSGSVDGIYWPGVSLALATALILVLRGRTFAEVHHAVPLVAGGSTIVLVLTSSVVFAVRDQSLAIFTACVFLALVALFFGSFIPVREYSPVLRRAAELVEYAAIAVVIPVACWVCGLYSAMRAL